MHDIEFIHNNIEYNNKNRIPSSSKERKTWVYVQ